MKPITKEEIISPTKAKAWLSEHYQRIGEEKFKQRNVSQSVVARYAADMQQGSWLLCPQPIVFDTDGNLLDGQHRLEAVVKSKKSIPFLVSTGWPTSNNGLSTMDVIDRGKPRSVAQQMQLHGYHHACAYSSCVQFCARIAWQRTVSLSLPGALYVLEKLNLRDRIDRIMTHASHSTRDFQGRIVGPLAYYHTAAPEKAEQFAGDFFQFTAAKDSPVQTFLKWQNAGPRVTDIRLKAICACLRAHHAGELLTKVHPNIEAVAWLANLNPKLRDNIRQAVSSTK